MTLKTNAPVQICESVYWLGSTNNDDFLQTNAYLVYRGGTAAIIDPGPVTVFWEEFARVKDIVNIKNIRALIISHQDPDVCSSMPLWEDNGFEGSIIAHWRTSALISAYGLSSVFFQVNESNTGANKDFLSLSFLSMPYLHSPGAMAVFDEETGVLFSGDIFGALGRNINLYADEHYLKRMLVFHEHYMPSSGILGMAVNRFSQIPLKIICPQHGCIINKDIPKYLETLRKARCGRLNTFADAREKENRLDMDELKKINFDLQENLVLNNEEKLKDNITGLYNTAYFNAYLPIFMDNNKKGFVVYFRLDGMRKFNNDYGFAEGDSAIAVFAGIIQENKPDEVLLFRDNGPVLISIFPDSLAGLVQRFIDNIREQVRNSDRFIQKVTCGAVFAGIEEFINNNSMSGKELLKNAIRERIQILDGMGPDSVCGSRSGIKPGPPKPIIVIIDSDLGNAELLKEYFSIKKFDAIVCSNGDRAMHIIDLNRPLAIICEINVSHKNGFSIRKQLLAASDLKKIPFIFISHQKDEKSVKKAFELNVVHYLKKPLMISELYNLVKSFAGNSNEY